MTWLQTTQEFLTTLLQHKEKRRENQASLWENNNQLWNQAGSTKMKENVENE
jgi:hypothetical protein